MLKWWDELVAFMSVVYARPLLEAISTPVYNLYGQRTACHWWSVHSSCDKQEVSMHSQSTCLVQWHGFLSSCQLRSHPPQLNSIIFYFFIPLGFFPAWSSVWQRGGGIRFGRKTLPTILIPKGVQQHPINEWVPGQAHPFTTIHMCLHPLPYQQRRAVTVGGDSLKNTILLI